LGKRGRPRKHKEREKSGRGSRAAAEREIKDFAKWQRRHLLGLVPEVALLDQKAATPLGALYLGKQITEEEYDAGENYQQIFRHYRIVSGMPLDLPSRMGVRGADNREYPSEVVNRARLRYLALRGKLVRTGKGVLSAVNELVLDERQLVARRIELAKKGLKSLTEIVSPSLTSTTRRVRPV